MITSRDKNTLEVMEAVLYIRGRIFLDEQRNKLFNFLDKKSKILDGIANRRISKFDVDKYEQFRHITKNMYHQTHPVYDQFRYGDKEAHASSTVRPEQSDRRKQDGDTTDCGSFDSCDCFYGSDC